MADESPSERARIRGAFPTGIAVIAPSVITLGELVTERGRRGDRGDGR